MYKIGDYVTRKKYNSDVLFVIKDIKNNKYILSGVDLRLYADAYEDDLILTIKTKKKENKNLTRKLDTNNYFYIPGIILHLDSDQEYLDRCLDYYKEHKIKCYGYIFNEKEYINNIDRLLKKHKPNILVITGHDAYYKDKNKYRNSEHFIKVVDHVRKNYDNELIIISGACQSDFINLIKVGSSYASSPAHINVHALDPAIIASFLALSDVNEVIKLDELLSMTTYGSDGYGGIITKGTMKIGTPRKDKN